ncbi:hypothetical protein HJG60_007763 [Phyllostomus discolor]|uniref:Uncharacterized protein n=1 Tax=Phyllostomus discolor TaxID=89673 RepID=A0A834BH71_9CHIR|nr:hypothetical protein HJG60_007763 [Phyllostomus discolor]
MQAVGRFGPGLRAAGRAGTWIGALEQRDVRSFADSVTTHRTLAGETAGAHCLIALEARSPRSRCWQGQFPRRPLSWAGRGPPSCCFSTGSSLWAHASPASVSVPQSPLPIRTELGRPLITSSTVSRLFFLQLTSYFEVLGVRASPRVPEGHSPAHWKTAAEVTGMRDLTVGEGKPGAQTQGRRMTHVGWWEPISNSSRVLFTRILYLSIILILKSSAFHKERFSLLIFLTPASLAGYLLVSHL